MPISALLRALVPQSVHLREKQSKGDSPNGNRDQLCALKRWILKRGILELFGVVVAHPCRAQEENGSIPECTGEADVPCLKVQGSNLKSAHQTMISPRCAQPLSTPANTIMFLHWVHLLGLRTLLMLGIPRTAPGQGQHVPRQGMSAHSRKVLCGLLRSCR